MFAVKAKIYGVLYNQSSYIAFDETSSYWSAPKAPNFSAFLWSPHVCLVFFGQHFVTTRVVHLPKRTEASLITESDESDLITESDQAVRVVNSCNNWFLTISYLTGQCVVSLVTKICYISFLRVLYQTNHKQK